MRRRFAVVLPALALFLSACGGDDRTAEHCADQLTPPPGTITGFEQWVTVDETELRESPGGDVLIEIAAEQPLLDLTVEREGHLEVACMHAVTNADVGFVDKDDVERKP